MSSRPVETSEHRRPSYKINSFYFLKNSYRQCSICLLSHTVKPDHMYMFECKHLVHVSCYVAQEHESLNNLNQCPVCGKQSGIAYVINEVFSQYVLEQEEKEHKEPPYVVPSKSIKCIPQFSDLRCPCCKELLYNMSYGPCYILKCQHIYHVSCFLYHILHHYDEPTCLVCNQPARIPDAYNNTFRAHLTQSVYASLRASPGASTDVSADVSAGAPDDQTS